MKHPESNSTEGLEPVEAQQKHLYKVQAYSPSLNLPKQFPKAKPIKVPCYVGMRIDWMGMPFRQLVEYSLKSERRKARIADESKAGVFLLARALASALSVQIQRQLCTALSEISYRLSEIQQWRVKRLEPKLEVLEFHLGIKPQVVSVTGQPILSTSCRSE